MIIGIAGIAFFLFQAISYKYGKSSRKPMHNLIFILGALFFIVGLATEVYSFLLVGLAYMVVSSFAKSAATKKKKITAS